MLSTKTTRRVSLPLTARDEHELQLLREYADHLDQLGIGHESDAALLHSIHEIGIQVLKERIAEIGYGLLAHETVDADKLDDHDGLDREQRRARRNRQAARWGDE